MKTYKFYFVILFLILSISSVRANDNNFRGIDLGEYAFGIPAEQLNFDTHSKFTLSFWTKVKEFNHTENGTQFVNIRNVTQGAPMSDWGWMYSLVGDSFGGDFDGLEIGILTSNAGDVFLDKELNSFKFNTEEWTHFSFVFSYDTNRALLVYINGKPTYKVQCYNTTYSWTKKNIIMLGGVAKNRSSLNAYVDKVQLYNKALSQTEVSESITMPLLNDESLLGYWDFEDGCTTDADGFMIADNGTIKATLYKILSNSSGYSIGTEIQPFVFGEGVDPESVIQGVEENVVSESKTKAFVSNGELNIENAEGINSIVVYDATGKVITSANANGATSTQIKLPSNTKGVLIVKVINDVVKVMLN